jgi:hypothetical protein
MIQGFPRCSWGDWWKGLENTFKKMTTPAYVAVVLQQRRDLSHPSIHPTVPRRHPKSNKWTRHQREASTYTLARRRQPAHASPRPDPGRCRPFLHGPASVDKPGHLGPRPVAELYGVYDVNWYQKNLVNTMVLGINTVVLTQKIIHNDIASLIYHWFWSYDITCS